jgi:hypothetical protein
MRGHVVLLALLLPLGCGAHVRPAVIPNLTQVPDDKRGDIIDSSLVRPTQEQQPTTKRGRQIETGAATAAAILGQIFSTTENTGMGFQMVEDAPHPSAVQPQQDNGEKPPPPAPADPDHLVPWIHLTK